MKGDVQNDRYYDEPRPIPTFFVDGEGHWIWTRSTKGKSRGGAYGRWQKAGPDYGRNAHAVVWEIFNGSVPAGLEVDHICNVTLCVNPAHLQAITQKENSYRSNNLGGINHRKTHCMRGHEFTPENTYLGQRRPGSRACRICKRDTDKANRLTASQNAKARREADPALLAAYRAKERARWARRSLAAKESSDTEVHGVSCKKRPHDNPNGGYLHSETDDRPYDVDGYSYCGRCHMCLP